MLPQSDDTPPEVERILLEGYRRMTPAQKLQRVCGLNAMLRELTAAAIRAQYGESMSERELQLRLCARRLDRDTMIRAFGWDPEVEGY